MAFNKARRLLGAGALVTCALVPVPSANAAGSVVNHINAVRASHGLAPLRETAALDHAASAHCSEMLSGVGFTHASRAGSFDQRVHRYVRARTVGETIAWLPRPGSAAVVRDWMNSPPHRAVLLSSQFHRIGVCAQHGHLNGSRGVAYTADVAS